MIRSPAAGVCFDIRKVGGGSYGHECWKVFWDSVDAGELEDVELFQGDTAATLRGDDGTFCIALHGTETQLDHAIEALEQSPAFRRLAAAPAFVWNEELADEPLVPAGKVGETAPSGAGGPPDVESPPPAAVEAAPNVDETAPTYEASTSEPSTAGRVPTTVVSKARPRRSIVIGAIVAVVTAMVIAAVVLPRFGMTADPVDVILTSSDSEEVAAAMDEIAQQADLESLRRLVGEAASRPEVAARLEAIRDLLIDRFSGAPPVDRIRILEALTIVDDPASATTLVDALLSDDDPSVRAAAAGLIPTLDQAQASAIQSLIDARPGSGTPEEERQIEDVLRAIGDPAIEAVAALQGRPKWTLDFLVSVGDPLTWLHELTTSNKLSDLQLAAASLLRLERINGEMAAPLWRELADSLRELVTPKTRRALQIAEILRDMERVRVSLARPIQKELVAALLPKLGQGGIQAVPDFTLAEALARLGKPAVDQLIPIARQRPGAFVSQQVINRADEARNALVTMISVNRKALTPLMDALKGRDYELIADLMLFYIQLGKPGSEGILIEAQNRHGDTLTALHFLESGNAKLENGARSWAARNGYTITGSPSGFGSWGTAR